MLVTVNDIEELLRQANSEVSMDLVLRYLTEAEHKARELEKNEANTRSCQLLSTILSERALNTIEIGKRDKLWQEVLSVLQKGWTRSNDSLLAYEIGTRTIDYIEDEYTYTSSALARDTLNKSKAIIDQSIKNESDDIMRAMLLSRKSGILRFIALNTGDKPTQQRFAEEARRCAKKASELGGLNGDIKLQEGLSVWLMARFVKSDSEYNDLLNTAEECFWQACEAGNHVHSLITLSRFYRTTNQPPPCCNVFLQYLKYEKSQRRALRNSYIYGEAVTQLWYGRYPVQDFENHAQEAEILLEKALDAGYRTARIVLSLAFIRACKGDKNGGDITLSELLPEKTTIHWMKALSIAQNASLGKSPADLISKGFALGINDSRVWNKLGTYALDFLADKESAEIMYREAIKLNKTNSIALTNLAKLLILKDEKNSKEEAERMLQKAEAYSDTRYFWWRNVKSLIKKDKGYVFSGNVETNIQKHIEGAQSLAQIRHQYGQLKRMSDHSARGKLFETLIKALMKISLGNATGAQRVKALAGYRDEIDGMFYFDKDAYVYELKWTSEKTDKIEIGEFIEKLKPLGIWGLFISMSGYGEDAIGRAREYVDKKRIILMDGEELELVIMRFIPIDYFLRTKQMYYYKREPYHKMLEADIDYAV